VKRETVNVATMLEDMYEGNEGVEVHVEDAARGLSIPCDRMALSKACANAVQNALDAIQESQDEQGTELPKVLVVVDELTEMEGGQERRYVNIAVYDKGPGIGPPRLLKMGPNERPRIFELNNSTKDMGTGFGTTLMWYTIAIDHRGEIIARRRPSGGTEVAMRIPAFSEGEEAVPASKRYLPLHRYLSEQGNREKDIRRFIEVLDGYDNLLLEVGCGNTAAACQLAEKNRNFGILAIDMFDTHSGMEEYKKWADDFEAGELLAQKSSDVLPNVATLRATPDIINCLPADKKLDFVLQVTPDAFATKDIHDAAEARLVSDSIRLIIKPLYTSKTRRLYEIYFRANFTCEKQGNSWFMGVHLLSASSFPNSADALFIITPRKPSAPSTSIPPTAQVLLDADAQAAEAAREKPARDGRIVDLAKASTGEPTPPLDADWFIEATKTLVDVIASPDNTEPATREAACEALKAIDVTKFLHYAFFAEGQAFFDNYDGGRFANARGIHLSGGLVVINAEHEAFQVTDANVECDRNDDGSAIITYDEYGNNVISNVTLTVAGESVTLDTVTLGRDVIKVGGAQYYLYIKEDGKTIIPLKAKEFEATIVHETTHSSYLTDLKEKPEFITALDTAVTEITGISGGAEITERLSELAVAVQRNNISDEDSELLENPYVDESLYRLYHERLEDAGFNPEAFETLAQAGDMVKVEQFLARMRESGMEGPLVTNLYLILKQWSSEILVNAGFDLSDGGISKTEEIINTDEKLRRLLANSLYMQDKITDALGFALEDLKAAGLFVERPKIIFSPHLDQSRKLGLVMSLDDYETRVNFLIPDSGFSPFGTTRVIVAGIFWSPSELDSRLNRAALAHEIAYAAIFHNANMARMAIENKWSSTFGTEPEPSWRTNPYYKKVQFPLGSIDAMLRPPIRGDLLALMSDLIIKMASTDEDIAKMVNYDAEFALEDAGNRLETTPIMARTMCFGNDLFTLQNAPALFRLRDKMRELAVQEEEEGEGEGTANELAMVNELVESYKQFYKRLEFIRLRDYYDAFTSHDAAAKKEMMRRFNYRTAHNEYEYIVPEEAEAPEAVIGHDYRSFAFSDKRSRDRAFLSVVGAPDTPIEANLQSIAPVVFITANGIIGAATMHTNFYYDDRPAKYMLIIHAMRKESIPPALEADFVRDGVLGKIRGFLDNRSSLMDPGSSPVAWARTGRAVPDALAEAVRNDDTITSTGVAAYCDDTPESHISTKTLASLRGRAKEKLAADPECKTVTLDIGGGVERTFNVLRDISGHEGTPFLVSQKLAGGSFSELFEQILRSALGDGRFESLRNGPYVFLTTRHILSRDGSEIYDHIAGDDVSNGVILIHEEAIGIAAVLNSSDDPRIAGADAGSTALQVIVEHELRHEATSLSSAHAEAEFARLDIERLLELSGWNLDDSAGELERLDRMLDTVRALHEEGYVSDDFLDEAAWFAVQKVFDKVKVETGEGSVVFPKRRLRFFVYCIKEFNYRISELYKIFLRNFDNMQQLRVSKTELTEEQRRDVDPVIEESSNLVRRKIESLGHPYQQPGIAFAPKAYIKSMTGRDTPAYRSTIFHEIIIRSDADFLANEAELKHVLMHELLHVNSFGFAPAFLNEAMTEYLTLKFLEMQSWQTSTAGIMDQEMFALKKLFSIISDATGLSGENLLIDAYFTGDYSKIERAVGRKKWKDIMLTALTYHSPAMFFPNAVRHILDTPPAPDVEENRDDSGPEEPEAEWAGPEFREMTPGMNQFLLKLKLWEREEMLDSSGYERIALNAILCLNNNKLPEDDGRTVEEIIGELIANSGVRHILELGGDVFLKSIVHIVKKVGEDKYGDPQAITLDCVTTDETYLPHRELRRPNIGYYLSDIANWNRYPCDLIVAEGVFTGGSSIWFPEGIFGESELEYNYTRERVEHLIGLLKDRNSNLIMSSKSKDGTILLPKGDVDEISRIKKWQGSMLHDGFATMFVLGKKQEVADGGAVPGAMSLESEKPAAGQGQEAERQARLAAVVSAYRGLAEGKKVATVIGVTPATEAKVGAAINKLGGKVFDMVTAEFYDRGEREAKTWGSLKIALRNAFSEIGEEGAVVVYAPQLENLQLAEGLKEKIQTEFGRDVIVVADRYQDMECPDARARHGLSLLLASCKNEETSIESVKDYMIQAFGADVYGKFSRTEEAALETVDSLDALLHYFLRNPLHAKRIWKSLNDMRKRYESVGAAV